ncbi:multicopper oxidase domain-containing protein [Candidatus Binatia bacterium]|nr:multicopper oxidase domain-containing protein [Candidatus Binatia bacterium]
MTRSGGSIARAVAPVVWWLVLVLVQACSNGGGDGGGSNELVTPEVRTSSDGVLSTTLRAARSPVEVAGLKAERLVYEGQYPGPTLRVKPGDRILVDLVNDIVDAPTNLHFHGFHVSPKPLSDDPFLEVVPGESVQIDVQLPSDHPSGLYWYHPHYHPRVSPQVYEGMSGAIIVEGALDELPGVKGLPEQLFVLKEVGITPDGKRLENYPDWQLPDTVFTINGQLDPTLRVHPGETQRWRFLNASTAFTYRIALDGHVLNEIAQDGNTLAEVSPQPYIDLLPGGRFEAIVQIGDAGTYALRTLAYEQGVANTPDTVLASVVAEGDRVETQPLPTTLLPFTDLSQLPVDRQRRLKLSVQLDPLVFLIDDQVFDPDVDDQVVELGALEEWKVFNVSNEMHPFHIHQNPFQLTEINGRPVTSRGYLDTVAVPANGSITFRTQFLDFTGRFVYHCHILPHEDNSMMGTVAVTEDGSAPSHGDAAAGKAVFLSAGCGDCHTLANAGTSGTIGPSLDQHIAVMGIDGIASIVRRGRRDMPAFGGKLSEAEIRNVSSYLRLFAGDHTDCPSTPGGPDFGHAQHCW